MTEDGIAGFDVDELCLSFLVRQAWMSMRTSVESVLEGHGLSLAQYACLLVLERQPGITIADLGRAMSSTRQSMNELLRGLGDQGLVERRQHATDRRSQTVFLTEAGHERLNQARPRVSEREQELEKAFSGGERSAARAWLRGVVHAAS
jgi:DNA-binding MarR family transcriptional regulator